MASRYDNRRVFRNGDKIYYNILEDRGLSSVVQYVTPRFAKVTQGDLTRVAPLQKVWTVGDRLYKLAAEHYGNSKLWWVIARFNNKPTDAHCKLGEIIYIPLPLETMLQYYRD
jgi:hypothetical protein